MWHRYPPAFARMFELSMATLGGNMHPVVFLQHADEPTAVTLHDNPNVVYQYTQRVFGYSTSTRLRLLMKIPTRKSRVPGLPLGQPGKLVGQIPHMSRHHVNDFAFAFHHALDHEQAPLQ